MTETLFSPSSCVTTSADHEPLQDYVRALLARQHALDTLETIHEQINHIWAAMRRLLDNTRSAARKTKIDKIARIAQARAAYRALEKRREECIATLHQAERRAQSALQFVIATAPKRLPWKSRNLASSPKNRGLRRKVKNAISQAC